MQDAPNSQRNSERVDERVDECTVCGDPYDEAFKSHPTLGVLICKRCAKDIPVPAEAPEGKPYCQWCGIAEANRDKDRVTCTSTDCSKGFCKGCLDRNQEQLGFSWDTCFRDGSWLCLICYPVPIKRMKRVCSKLVIDANTDAGAQTRAKSTPGGELLENDGTPRKRQFKMMAESEESRNASQVMRKNFLRIRPISGRLHANSEDSASDTDSGDEEEVGQRRLGGFRLNDTGDAEAEVLATPELSGALKPHQKHGIRAMWVAVIQSIENCRLPLDDQEGPRGFILAHCMGLGKTLQVITFLHTVLLYKELGSLQKALVIAPKGVIYNWRDEFKKWGGEEGVKELKVRLVEPGLRTPKKWLKIMKKWAAKGGVLLITYDTYTAVLQEPKEKPRGKDNLEERQRQHQEFLKYLRDPGPDIAVLDEAHIKLKGTNTKMHLSLKQIKTRRRILLTGTPLQNNLGEYFSLINFVAPNVVGKNQQEFDNRFAEPITKATEKGASENVQQKARQMLFIFYSKIERLVHRRDHTVLSDDLPPKVETVVKLVPTQTQRKIYRAAQKQIRESKQDDTRKNVSFLEQHSTLSKICCHPVTLMPEFRNGNGKRKKKTAPAGDCSSDESASETEAFSKSEEGEEDADELEMHAPTDSKARWGAFVKRVAPAGLDKPNDPAFVEMSSKLKVALEIIKLAMDAGDKVVLFSHYLSSLDVIESQLKQKTISSKTKSVWAKGRDYERLDGSSSSQTRVDVCRELNRQDSRLKLLVCSTRAVSLGVNMVGANRVILFDLNWNPSHDLQAIFRTYRYGQTQCVYVYRLMIASSVEEAIWKKQVQKLDLALTVVDKMEAERHFNLADMMMVDLESDDEDIIKEVAEDQNGNGPSEVAIPHPARAPEVLPAEPTPTNPATKTKDGDDIECPPSTRTIRAAKRKKRPPPKPKSNENLDRDSLLPKLIGLLSTKRLVKQTVAHDSLFHHNGATELSETEQKAAWAEYSISPEERLRKQRAVEAAAHAATAAAQAAAAATRYSAAAGLGGPQETQQLVAHASNNSDGDFVGGGGNVSAVQPCQPEYEYPYILNFRANKSLAKREKAKGRIIFDISANSPALSCKYHKFGPEFIGKGRKMVSLLDYFKKLYDGQPDKDRGETHPEVDMKVLQYIQEGQMIPTPIIIDYDTLEVEQCLEQHKSHDTLLYLAFALRWPVNDFRVLEARKAREKTPGADASPGPAKKRKVDAAPDTAAAAAAAAPDTAAITEQAHTGEKPYGCSRCPERFINSSQVATHERTHTATAWAARQVVVPTAAPASPTTVGSVGSVTPSSTATGGAAATMSKILKKNVSEIVAGVDVAQILPIGDALVLSKSAPVALSAVTPLPSTMASSTATSPVAARLAAVAVTHPSAGPMPLVQAETKFDPPVSNITEQVVIASAAKQNARPTVSNATEALPQNGHQGPAPTPPSKRRKVTTPMAQPEEPTTPPDSSPITKGTQESPILIDDDDD